MQVRRAARVIAINEDGHVLLFRCVDPHDPKPPVWITPGGALENGEDVVAGACRELFEETGQVVDGAQLNGPVGFAEGPFVFRGTPGHQHDTYFAWRTSTFIPAAENVDAVEIEIMGEHRWMSPEEIEAHEDAIYPATLADLVRDIHAGVEITEPRVLPW